MSHIYTLVIEVTKTAEDDLPEEAVGAAFVVFCPADDADQAVRDTVKLFKDAAFSPIEVSNFGTIKEREADGYEWSNDEMMLVEEAAEKNAVIVLDKQVFYDEADQGVRN